MTGQQQFVNILKQEYHKTKLFFLVLNFQKVRLIVDVFLRGPTTNAPISNSSNYRGSNYRGFSMRVY